MAKFYPVNKVMLPIFKTLIKYKRSGLYEQEHNGLIVLVNEKKTVMKIGEDNSYPFFQRSCMKPLQAALLIDKGVDEAFEFDLREIAILSASHVGSQEHIEVVRGLLSKIGLDDSFLQCSAHKPICLEEQERLILENENYSAFHNNCSGKHAAMLALCIKMGWDLNSYLDEVHPLNKALIERVKELCEVQDIIVPVSKDGCGLSTLATTLDAMGKGFLNLFLNEKYHKIKEAFIKYPYLIGGHCRLDSEIINCSDGKLIAKVGAGGLCSIVNVDTKECLVVKIADTDMKARSLVVINSLIQLGWLDSQKVQAANISSLYDINISTLNGEIIGEVEFCFAI